MIKESEVPQWVWSGLKEKWSKINDPEDRAIASSCTMCHYMYVVLKIKDCNNVCPLSEMWCSIDSQYGVLGARLRTTDDWKRNVKLFNDYIDRQLDIAQYH